MNKNKINKMKHNQKRKNRTNRSNRLNKTYRTNRVYRANRAKRAKVSNTTSNKNSRMKLIIVSQIPITSLWVQNLWIWMMRIWKIIQCLSNKNLQEWSFMMKVCRTYMVIRLMKVWPIWVVLSRSLLINCRRLNNSIKIRKKKSGMRSQRWERQGRNWNKSKGWSWR